MSLVLFSRPTRQLSDLYKDFCIEKVKYLKLVPAKISAPQAKAIYSYSQPRRVTRSSGCSELYLSLDEKDNIYSDAYGHHSRSVQVDLSSPDRCEEAEEIFGDNRSSKLEKKKPSQAITSASVHYLSNDSDSDDNITTVSTSMRSQPTIKQTGLFAERNRERLREDTQLKAVALSSESVLDCLPLTLSTSELNVSSTPEEWVAAGSQDNHFSPGVKDTESGESCEKRGKKIVNSAVQRDPGLLNESINSATITDSSSMEPQQSSQSSEQSAAPSCHHESLSTSAITVAKPVRKTPLPSSTCTSAESVTAKDVLTQSVSPFSKDKRLPPGSAHSITNSSNSKPIQITNTSHSSSSSGSSSSSRKRSAGDLAEGNHTHCTTSTRARAAARRKDENDDTAASGFSGNSIHSREKRPRQVKDKSSLVDLTDASGDG